MSTRASFPIRTTLAIVAGLVLAMLSISPVLGHAELETSDPAADAVLATPPTEVTLTFSEGLDASKSSFKVTGPDGAAGTGTAAKDGATVMTADGLTLGPGEYTVAWTSVADDGDLVRGTFTFTVTEPTPVPATPTPAPSDAPTASPSAAATPSPVASATAAPSAATGDTGTPASSTGDVLLPIVAALVLVAIVGALVLRRRSA